MEIKTLDIEYIKRKIKEIDETQKNLDVMIKENKTIDFNQYIEYVKFHFEYIGYDGTKDLPDFIVNDLSEKEKAYLAKGLLQGTKQLFKTLIVMYKLNHNENQ